MRRMYMKLSITLVIFMSMFVTGCSTGPAFSPVTSIAPDKALVYMYRKSSIVGSANTYRIWINDMHVTDMGNGGYYPYFAYPGELAFKMKVKKDLLHMGLIPALLEKERTVLKINVEAGRTYYVKHKWDSQAKFSNLAVMELVDEGIGSREIVKCKGAKGVESKE